jgi:FlaA1/EpsC-like NDP-sugar epimerase
LIGCQNAGLANHGLGFGQKMQVLLTRLFSGLSRQQKQFIAACIDVSLCLLTVALAYYLRLGELIRPHGLQWVSYAAAIALAIPIYFFFGLYKAIFRYAGWGSLSALWQASAVYGAIYSAVFTVTGIVNVPRTLGLIQPILLFLAASLWRILARFWLSGTHLPLIGKDKRRPVLIYGAGVAGRQLVAAIANSKDMRVVGFIDDNLALHGSVMNGIKIFPSQDIARLVTRLGVVDILLAIPSTSRSRRAEVIEFLRGSKANIRTLPSIVDLADGSVTISDIRDLKMEDILGRNQVEPNQVLLSRNVKGKTVLVTGAGGSIGSELCRQILSLDPKILLLVEMSEASLYTINQELSGQALDLPNKVKIVPLLARVQDEDRMKSIFETWSPDTVYHAAAYKHVPLVEHNLIDGVRNNVIGTLVLSTLARKTGVGCFVLISTDKAVRPTNVMGTTKRLAEMILQALHAEKSKTVFTMVRFGNVLGSSGSVVPLFRDQIKAGRRLTITHSDVTRYFMSIAEAAELVIQAGAMAKGGEVFVLDMGDPVRIQDLARKIVELSGLSVKDQANPFGDIEFEFIGLRPGEKLFEELLIGNRPEPTIHPKVMKANEKFLPLKELERELDRLRVLMQNNELAQVREYLQRMVPEFSPVSDIVDWVFLERQRRDVEISPDTDAYAAFPSSAEYDGTH